MDEHARQPSRRGFLAGAATLAGAAGVAGLTAVAAKPAEAREPSPAAVGWHEPRDPDVERLLARMTLEEKVGQLNIPQVLPQPLIPPTSPTGSPDNQRRFVAGTWVDYLGPGGGLFGLLNQTVGGLFPVEHPRTPREQAELTNALQRTAAGTRLGIPVLQVAEGTNGCSAPGATIFPEGPGMGATWNPGLVERAYAAVAAEARSMGVHVLNTLVAEVNRDPRFGRVCEYFGEDAYHVGRIVAGLVRGVQGGDVSRPDRAAASLCHFPAQTPNVGGLEGSSVEIGERMLRQTHLPPWRVGFSDEGAMMTLACQATIDGVPTHASEFLLTTVLRDEMHFNGVVISEGGGFETIVAEGLAATQKQAGALAIRAGVDVGITWEPAYLDQLVDNVREGHVPVALVDRAVRRVLLLKKRLGLFQQALVDPDTAERTVHSQAHQAIALQAARESLILLKNDDLLPLAGGNRIAVIGPNADNSSNLLGDYNPWPPFQPIPSILDAIRAHAPAGTTVTHAPGCTVLGNDRSGIDAAVAAARNADVAVLVLGEQPKSFTQAGSTDGEATDIADLGLTGVQDELVAAVVATGTPVVAILINGRALAITQLAATVPAIVEAFLPGEFGGQAVAELLFGVINPSGRLPVTVPRGVGQLPMYYDQKRMRAAAADYVDSPVAPLYPFGFGLSYTTFEYRNLRLSSSRIRSDGTVRVTVDVHNTGHRAGATVVQLYLTDVLATVSLPARMLRGFAKVTIPAGGVETVQLTLGPRELALVDQRMRTVVEPGTFEVHLGASSTDTPLSATFEVLP
jgi:beta-glucosidase